MVTAVEVILKPGDVLYEEGTRNDCGYLIESGEIVLYMTVDGQRRDCEIRGPGSIVGELAILTGEKRKVTVEALTECRAYKISSERIIALHQKADPILKACIETAIKFSARLKEAKSTTKRLPIAKPTIDNVDNLVERFQFERDLEIGLENDQFYMAFQPIVDLQSRKIIGFEALSRWHHPKLGNIPPDKFIDIAEQIGKIEQITDFAILEACRALRDFGDQCRIGSSFFASVNISGADLGRPGFTEFLAHAIDIFDIYPHQLSLEITERSVIPDTKETKKNLVGLKTLGVGLSIDDFGTGYSNFAYLKQLPLTTIKIDRSFAGFAHEDDISRSIVSVLIQLGDDLGMKVIAEGLETTHDVETLSILGCNFGQGYHFHKPVEKNEFKELLVAGSGKEAVVA